MLSLSLCVSASGSVAVVEMAPDPAVSPVDAALYFRCRKCRQLLFTDGDVLQHALGEGRESFGHRHRGKSDRSKVSSRTWRVWGRPTFVWELFIAQWVVPWNSNDVIPIYSH